MKRTWRDPTARAQVLLERAREHGMENLSAAEWDFLVENLHYGTQELDRLIEKAMETNARYDEAGYPL